jgi:hypothetical protein
VSAKDKSDEIMTDGAGPPRDARDTAVYIQRMAKELRALAVEAELGFLAYLLAMVEDDAEATVHQLADT